MENKIKKILSTFLKTDANNIIDSTIIDSSALQGSILIHRFYSVLKKEGIVIDDYSNIKTFGDLKQNLGLSDNGEKGSVIVKTQSVINQGQSSGSELNIGIDIENISNFPGVEDYRVDKFYTSIFSQKEISYCIVKSNPSESFAGKFSAKEAIKKADSSLKAASMTEIEILNDEDGKPLCNGFSLSISHSGDTVVAVAIKDIYLKEPEKIQEIKIIRKISCKYFKILKTPFCYK